MPQMTVLVTGSRGIVGRHVCDQLRLNPNLTVQEFEGDIRNEQDIRLALIRSSRVDLLINLAAVVPVETVDAQPAKAYSVNVGGVLALLNAISGQENIPYFFQCSSAHVYSPAEFPISEDGPTNPLSTYGKTKLLAEVLVKEICTRERIPWCIGRLFSIHDQRQRGSFLRPRIEARLQNADPNAVFELRGADSSRDFLTAEEAAKYIVALSVNRYEGIINIGSGKATRIRDFVQSIAKRKLDILSVGSSDTLVADVTLLKAFQASLGRTTTDSIYE